MLAEDAHNDLKTALYADIKDKEVLTLGDPLLIKGDDGESIEIDKKVQQLAASLDRNLRFIEYNLKRAPIADIKNLFDTYEAGSPQLTGELWNSILYLVDNISYFDWWATEISDCPKILYYHPRNKKDLFLKMIGARRESQWLLQQTMDTHEIFKTMKIRSDDPLQPRNESELRAYVELSEMCNDSRILDVEFKNALKVKEYIRAWYVIHEAAEKHFAEKKQTILEKEGMLELSDLLILSVDALVTLLSEKGKLSLDSAQKSIELMTYWNMDHDVFSSPIFPTNEGTYLILTSIFLVGNPVRSVFRLLSHDSIDISFKGVSAERKLGKIFADMGFTCSTGYEYHDKSGDGDIDCIAFKEDAFFVCENKNVIPNESTYDRYRTMELFVKKASKQANRASLFIRENLPQVCAKLSVKISSDENVKIFPVVVTNLFGFTGMRINDVPVCDISALKKFATDKYVHQISKRENTISRKPIKELYKGELPTAKELLNQVTNPFQLEEQAKHVLATSISHQFTKELTIRVYEVKEI